MKLEAAFKHYLSSTSKYIPSYNSTYPDGIYLCKVINVALNLIGFLFQKIYFQALFLA